MPTTNLGLPLITGNMTANVPRDMNALAEEIDAKVASKVVVEGLATKTSVATIDEKVTTHLADNEKHVTGTDRNNWNNAIDGTRILPNHNNSTQKSPLSYDVSRTTVEFVKSSVVGLPGVMGTFSTIYTENGWNDASGGDIRQIAVSKFNNKMMTRRGNLSTNIWGTWSEIEISDNKNVANGYAGLDGSGKLPSSLFPTGASGSVAGNNADSMFVACGFTPSIVVINKITGDPTYTAIITATGSRALGFVGINPTASPFEQINSKIVEGGFTVGKHSYNGINLNGSTIHWSAAR